MAKIYVNEDVCKGCGLCVSVCPKHIVALEEEKINAKGYRPAVLTDASQCTGCAACAIICPDIAITVER